MIYIFFFVVLFDMFDVDKQKVLTHDGMFRIYKLMFTNAISDDHILALVFSALKHPDLARPGEITKNEFIQVFCDYELFLNYGIKLGFSCSDFQQVPRVVLKTLGFALEF